MVDILNPPDILLKSISVNEQSNGPEKDVYFYHGDHLGSANWITDYTGAPFLYIHYAPYGELIDNQVPYGYDERYKFTGKERDAETGYDYFGARFYWASIGHWLSVDPLADKYPNISPYAYCAWNPIKFIDPDGNKIVVGSWFGRVLAKLGINNFEHQTMMYLKEMKEMSPILNTAISRQGDAIEIQKGNLNEQKSIFYENIVREKQGDNARPYEYYKTEP